MIQLKSSQKKGLTQLVWILFGVVLVIMIYFILNTQKSLEVLNKENIPEYTTKKFFRYAPELCKDSTPDYIETNVNSLCRSQGYVGGGQWSCLTDKPKNFNTLNYACRVK